jgi:hypothetical protein
VGTFIEGFEITCQDDCKKLQSDLDAAARWEADWLMAFHPDKCTVLTITQKKTPFKHDYILHNHNNQVCLYVFVIAGIFNSCMK